MCDLDSYDVKRIGHRGPPCPPSLRRGWESEGTRAESAETASVQGGSPELEPELARGGPGTFLVSPFSLLTHAALPWGPQSWGVGGGQREL